MSVLQCLSSLKVCLMSPITASPNTCVQLPCSYKWLGSFPRRGHLHIAHHNVNLFYLCQVDSCSRWRPSSWLLLDWCWCYWLPSQGLLWGVERQSGSCSYWSLVGSRQENRLVFALSYGCLGSWARGISVCMPLHVRLYWCILCWGKTFYKQSTFNAGNSLWSMRVHLDLNGDWRHRWFATWRNKYK